MYTSLYYAISNLVLYNVRVHLCLECYKQSQLTGEEIMKVPIRTHVDSSRSPHIYITYY